ncbi:MAG: GTPase Era [Acidimicrobiales bacterium]
MSAFRSGFVAVLGRTNVGKSTLVNAMVGEKVTITSPRPNTTRSQVRGVLDRPGVQVVLVDTPGVHRPRSALGERMNASATSSLEDVDLVLALVDASAAIGPGDRRVLSEAVGRVRPSPVPTACGGGPETEGSDVRGDAVDPRGPGRSETRPGLFVVVNKVDRVRSSEVLLQLEAVFREVESPGRRENGGAEVDGRSGPGSHGVPVEYFPVSASTGEGIRALVDAVVDRMPEGPRYYPEGMVSDVAEAAWVADLVREELLLRAEEELPHSIACRVTEWEWPRVRCEILVERDSQKGIVIGRGGTVLKEVGTAVRAQMAPGAYLELFVRVEPRWQQREDALDRLGL